MSKNKKKNNNIRKKLRTILIVAVVIYLSFQILPALHASKLKTYIAKTGSIQIVEEVQGIVFKEEKVYKSTTSGQVTYLNQEGDRVGVGDKIAEIPINSNTEKLKEELQNIEKDIEKLSNTNKSTEIFQGDIEKNQQYIDELMRKISDAIISRDYKKVAELRKELNDKLDKQKTLTGQKGYSANQLSKLKDRREEILAEMETLNVEYNSGISGIVSYTIDGLEMIYTPNKLADFYPSNFKILDEHLIDTYAQKSIKAGEPIYKVIDNFEWYVTGLVTNKELLDSFQNKDSLIISLDDSDFEIRAEVFKINSDKDSGVLILRLNKHLYQFHKKRFVNLKIVLDEFKGLKIPTEAIVGNNGINGVYIKSIGGITKFRAIEILGQNSEFTVVKESTGFIKPSEESNKIYYLSIYDEIIIDGNKVTEGDIVN